jgi:hypothetical protein
VILEEKRKSRSLALLGMAVNKNLIVNSTGSG